MAERPARNAFIRENVADDAHATERTDMTASDLDPARKAKVQQSFAAQSLMRLFSAEILRIAPGEVVIRAPIGPDVRQQHGVAHAGLGFALGDTAAGFAALTLMPPDAEVMTAEMKIHLLAPAVGAWLVARGTVLRAGRRLTVVHAEVEAETEGGERSPVAVLLGTMVPVRPR